MRSTYSLNRADDWSGRLSLPIPLPRVVLLFATLFAIGIAVGWIATRPFVGSKAQTVTTTDYVAVVAQLYARDHNLSLARERLAVIGSPSSLVRDAVSAGRDGSLRDPSDGSAIDSLSQALGSDGSSSTTGTAAAAPSGEGQTSWIGPVIAFILALALGAIVLLRTAGLSFPRLSLPAARRPRPARDDLYAPVRASSSNGVAPRADAVPTRRATRPTATLDLASEEALYAPPARRTEPVREAPRSRVTARASRLLTFQSCYRFGDDPYDEIHPIIDPTSGTLIAACGLNAALKYDAGHPAGYYAFAAWMQDYVNGETLNAVGMVARGALQSQREQVEGWIERGQIDSVIVAERGTTTELQANELKATVTVVDTSVAGEDDRSYFDELTVRFEVVPKSHLDDV